MVLGDTQGIPGRHEQSITAAGQGTCGQGGRMQRLRRAVQSRHIADVLLVRSAANGGTSLVLNRYIARQVLWDDVRPSCE